MDFYRLFRPLYWLQVAPTSPTYDAWLNNLLDTNPKVERVSEAIAVVGGYKFWVANFPYGFGSLYRKSEALPKAKTRARLKNYIDNPATWIE
jgi:hypothetical protein